MLYSTLFLILLKGVFIPKLLDDSLAFCSSMILDFLPEAAPWDHSEHLSKIRTDSFISVIIKSVLSIFLPLLRGAYSSAAFIIELL